MNDGNEDGDDFKLDKQMFSKQMCGWSLLISGQFLPVHVLFMSELHTNPFVLFIYFLF